VLKNAFFCTPANGGNYGTISYTESGTTYEKQAITVRFDKPQKVTAIYISDRFPAGTTPTVTVNGAAATFTRVGSGSFDRRVKINWSGTVDSTGVVIGATD
jgi:expansin (peptidoglycan-binding protein)